MLMTVREFRSRVSTDIPGLVEALRDHTGRRGELKHDGSFADFGDSGLAGNRST